MDRCPYCGCMLTADHACAGMPEEMITDDVDELADDDSGDIDLDGPITCWCGATGSYEDLFDDSGLDEGCGGLASRHSFIRTSWRYARRAAIWFATCRSAK